MWGAAAWHVLEFMVSPRTLVTRLVGGGLWVSLCVTGGVSRRGLLLHLAVSEALTYLLWLLVPHGLTSVFALWLVLGLYERAAGPRVVVQKDAAFITEAEIVDSLLNQESLQVDASERDESGRVRIQTRYSYIVYNKTQRRSPPELKHGTALEIDQVVEVEAGPDPVVAKVVRREKAEPSSCFCLIFDDDSTVTVITQSRDISNQWLEALGSLLGSKAEFQQNEWLTRVMDEADLGEEEEEEEGPSSGPPMPAMFLSAPQPRGISLDASLKILDDVNRPTDKAYAAEIFNAFAERISSKKTSTLNRENFNKFFDVAAKRPEIHEIYSRILKNRRENVLQPQKLGEFMWNEQKELVSVEQCKKWIKQHEKIIPPFSFTSVGFTSFMLSEGQTVFNRDYKNAYQDMDQPLSHYYIATSHNTYLLKDQLKGKSSVDAYISAFRRGCKCVELDCWDGPNNEPVIYHGHTLTSKIHFRDVITAVREYAFCVSDYPVILSFENHCSLEQQRVMANHLINILGHRLYTKPVPDDETQLPSPTQLKGYVIVKARKLKEVTDEADEVDDDYSGDEEIAGAELTEEVVNKENNEDNLNEQVLKVAREADKGHESDDDGISMDSVSLSESSVSGTVNGTGDKEDSEEDSDEKGADRGRSGSKLTQIGSLLRKRSRKSGSIKNKPKIAKVAHELSDLVSYCQAVTFRGFQHAKQNHRHCEMSSFAEKKAMKFAKEDYKDFMAYNRQQLSRIYPAGARVDSSNYDPQPLWNAGCQLVALNYQTGSWPMQLNQGKFQENGGCGYVLKPEYMITDNSSYSQRGPYNSNEFSFLAIRVLSGHQVPYSSEKNVRSERTLSVQIRTTGVEADNQKEKTKAVKNNGYNPVWNEVVGFKIHVPELASIKFQLVEGRDSFLGQYTLPVHCLQQGYRRVPLLTKNSEPIPHASLFVHVEMKKR